MRKRDAVLGTHDRGLVPFRDRGCCICNKHAD
jgi:hypothetical protein